MKPTTSGRSANHGARWRSQGLLLVITAVSALSAEPGSPATSTNLLLIDRFGKDVLVPTNQVPPSLQPSAPSDLGKQVPTTPKGKPLPESVQKRIVENKPGREWFPTTPPVLMPYLGSLDEFGNTALQPGAAIPMEPHSLLAQKMKSAASELGLRYGWWQSFTAVSMTEVASGANTLQYYCSTFVGKWALREAPDERNASWLSTELNTQLGLSAASRNQTPQGNLGVIANPQATVFGPNGFWVSELALQQSLVDGKVVVLAGLVDQSNYLDANTYANNSQGQLLNSALVNSVVLPFPFDNIGLNLQWQPSDRWYAMFGTGANNQLPGNSPFADLSFDNWSYLFELAVTPPDVLGLGAGIYRLQPFVATVGSHTQPGIGLNLEQQLGTNSPFAWFGRFGTGGSRVTVDGAASQIATGLAMQAPLKHAGLFPRLSNDYLAAGFIWSQPSSVMKPVAHNDEYGFETTYVLQLTPLASLQPDFQVIWDPVNNPNAGHNFIFQIQLNLAW